MKKFTIYPLRRLSEASNLQFTIFLLLSTFYIVHCTLYIPVASATESTPSSSVQKKLEKLKEEIASKAAGLKEEVDRRLKDKAYVGILKNKSETSLTLSTLSGPKILNITQDTVFESKIKKRKFSKDSLAAEDYIASLGGVDETGVLTAKKVILLPKPQSGQKTYLWGQIISTSDNLITLRDKDSKNVATSFPKGVKFKIGDTVILTGSLNKNEIFEAEFLYVTR